MTCIASVVLAALLFTVASPSQAQTMSPEGASVYFIDLADGDIVGQTLTIYFGLRGMGVAPVGTEKDKTGPHHLLIDRPPLGKGEDGTDEFVNPLPADENHRHFGGGQTEVTIDLSPGQHTLQLAVGDHNHIPHDPPIVSEVITVTVQ